MEPVLEKLTEWPLRAKEAIRFAQVAHGEQQHAGRPYIFHLIETGEVLRCFDLGTEDMLCAAALHDVLEDTAAKYTEIYERFGQNVAELVWAVTDERGRTRDEVKRKTYPKTVFEGENAVNLKLADRIANFQTSIACKTGKKIYMYLEEMVSFRAALYPLGSMSLWTRLSWLEGEMSRVLSNIPTSQLRG